MMRAMLTAVAVFVQATLALAIEPGDQLFAKKAITLSADNGETPLLFSGKNARVEEVRGDKLLLRTREGNGWGNASDFLSLDAAREYFTQVIDKAPNDHTALIARANINLYADQPQLSVNDTTAALKQDPKLLWAYLIRSTAFQMLKNYPAALADADKAIELAPENPRGHNSRAWLLATADTDNFRNAVAAKESAHKACDLTNWKNRRYLDTLAAAHAEAGEFEEAIKWQTQAVNLAPKDAQDNYQKRLEIYTAGKPCRE